MLKVKRNHESAILPTRAHLTDAGADLYTPQAVIIPPLTQTEVNTQISIDFPDGHYLRIAPRSGLSRKGLFVNAGVVDKGYTGNIIVLMFNSTPDVIELQPGSKIAQMILEKITIPEITEVESLEETKRGEKGFGSSDEPFVRNQTLDLSEHPEVFKQLFPHG